MCQRSRKRLACSSSSSLPERLITSERVCWPLLLADPYHRVESPGRGARGAYGAAQTLAPVAELTTASWNDGTTIVAVVPWASFALSWTMPQCAGSTAGTCAEKEPLPSVVTPAPGIWTSGAPPARDRLKRTVECAWKPTPQTGSVTALAWCGGAAGAAGAAGGLEAAGGLVSSLTVGGPGARICVGLLPFAPAAEPAPVPEGCVACWA